MVARIIERYCTECFGPIYGPGELCAEHEPFVTTCEHCNDRAADVILYGWKVCARPDCLRWASQ